MKAILLALCLLLCHAAAFGAPIEQAVPADIAADYLESDAVLDEAPCAWREPLAAIFVPAVQHCTTPREAALFIAEHMTALTGAYYSTERRKPNMNALEALSEKKISCTGQSILLVCALRSVGLPARAVFVPTWNHIRGNHTWVEVWLEGEWQMIEFNERAFNTPWVMENIGFLDDTHPAQHVYAVAPSRPTHLVHYGGSRIRAVDVTPRYAALAAEWYAGANLPADHQRLLVDVKPRPQEATPITLEAADGTALATVPSPTVQNDLRYFARLNLPRCGGPYFLRIGPHRHPIAPTPASARVIQLPMQSE